MSTERLPPKTQPKRARADLRGAAAAAEKSYLITLVHADSSFPLASLPGLAAAMKFAARVLPLPTGQVRKMFGADGDKPIGVRLTAFGKDGLPVMSRMLCFFEDDEIARNRRIDKGNL